MSTIDIIKESGLTGEDMAAAEHMIMRSIHEKGKDRTPEDDAAQWEQIYRFSMAGALMGNANCMSSLGDIYYGQKTAEAKALEDPMAEALKWWEKAAQAGSGRSATNLGLLHLHKDIPGAGAHGFLEYDEAKAFEYFKLGYEQGDMKAGRHVGLCYKDGIGTEKNDEEAYKWFTLAAQRGDSSAALYVADSLLKGEGVKQDVDDAICRYEALVECKGHDVTNAAYALACIYRDGQYTAQDLAKSKAYFESVIKTANGREKHLKEAAEKALTEL